MSTFEVKQLRRKISLEPGEKVVEVEPVTKLERVKQELDPVVEMGAVELEQTNQEVDEVVRLNESELQNLSESEKRDIQMTTSVKGWQEYWRDKLVSELDILPEDIKPIAEKFVRGIKISGEKQMGRLQSYISRRIAALHKKEYIIRIQNRKQLEMAKLKQRLRDIDKRTDYEQDEQELRKTVFYNEKDDSMFVIEGDTNKELTIGDIAADYDWGIKYRPDSSMPDKLWRRVRKLCDYKEAKCNIENLLNDEIMIAEGGISRSAGVGFSLEKLISIGSADRVGFVAEQMAPSFLLRIQYNHPELGFKIEHSNVLEDVELKYDFKISFSTKKRGVAIEGDNMTREDYVDKKRKFGLQFTILTKQKRLDYKTLQIEKARTLISKPRFLKYIKKQVDDIVLMSLPFKDCEADFQEWLDNGQPSGGPEQYMSKSTKRTLIKKAFQGRIELTDEEIDKLVAQ